MASKKYYIVRGDFGNVYSLYWADNPEMEAHLPWNAERITRQKALEYCRDELERQKYDPAFAYYASSSIYPAGIGPEADLINNRRYELRNHIWERSSAIVRK